MISHEFSDDEPELETLNISNDQYYLPLAERPKQPIQIKISHEETLQIPRYGSRTIRHSLPAYDLWKAFFPTYMSETKYQNHHRPKLRHYNNGPQARNHLGLYLEHPIKNLSRHIFRNHKQLMNKVIQAINDGVSREDVMSMYLLINEARQLSAKDSELFLFEYCEEYPPVLSQVGMASNIKTYQYGLDPTSNSNSSSIKKSPVIGYDVVVKTEHQSTLIYYNSLKRGSKTVFIENNLFRAPVFKHEPPCCDFLVIRTRNSYYIRKFNHIFTVGQTFTLSVVPPPTDSNIHKFRCDLSNLYIHKLFEASDTHPKSMCLDTLMKLFPDYHKSVVQKRMRSAGAQVGYMCGEARMIRGNSNYGQLSTLDLRNIMHPEIYCLNISALAARQRLRGLNYSESMISPAKVQTIELEPEVLAAPWNTTRAVVSAMNGRAFLDFKAHLIDPTGSSREGFSCVAWVKSPTEEQQAKEMTTNGSNTRLASKPTLDKIPAKNPMRPKIIQEKLQRLAIYQREAQLIAEIQSKSLSIDDPMTSSEDEAGNDEGIENISESDFSQQLDDLSKMVIGGRTETELNYEKEEEERRQLLSDLRLNRFKDGSEELNKTAPKSNVRKSDEFNLASLKDKILVITRTYDQAGGKIQRTEIVREPRVIALYIKKRGGSLHSCQARTGFQSCGGGGQGNASFAPVESNDTSFTVSNHSRSTSLGPTELSRSDGTRVTISKKVLDNVRPTRHCRRQSSV